ncbi:hypothetical protein [Streptomyces arenae]|uniref:hypothetical protein n=1 Tax=Streptomyces arenae TaxID=29301 RepID=UPI0026588E7A|nr:hypothetical protein [Streptomyces arenae]MCG7205831.1 hypothetical protein [Streptomyces arenae]
MVTRKIAALVAAATAVVVAACAAWVYSGRTDPSPGRPPQADAGRLSARLPFYPFLHAPSERQWRIATAERRLAITCMAAHGYRYTPAEVPRPSAVTADHPLPFGLESLTRATAGPAPTASEQRESKAFLAALYGPDDRRVSAEGKSIKVSWPAQGCQAEAEKRLLGTERLRWLRTTIAIGEGEQQARRNLARDPAFRAADARWARCMRAAGVATDDPVGLLDSLPRTTVLATSPVARADVRCKGDTEYLRTAYARLAVAQQAWLDAHPATVATWRSLMRRQDRVARDVLG